MPAQWTSRVQMPMSANDIARTGNAFYQPFVQGTGVGARAQGDRVRFQTAYQPERPYSQVGKMSVNLGNLAGGGPEGAGNQTKGFFTGLGAGAGELIGGFFGDEGKKIGSTIGGAIGGVAGTPFDIAGNALGVVPAIPFLGGAAGMPGMGGKGILDLPFMAEEERNKVLQGFDGNPFNLAKHMSEWNKHEWEGKVAAGEINPLFKDMAPAASIGDQVMQLMGVLGLASTAVQRTLAGGGTFGPLDAVKRIMDTEDENLNPEIVQLKHDYMAGALTKDRFLDELVMHNAGYSNDWGLNLLGSLVLDPLLIGGTVASMAGKAAMVGKMAQATKFIEMLPKAQFDDLARAIETRAAAEGKVVSQITGPEMLQEAQRLGVHGDAIAEATRQLTAREQFGASIAHLEPIFNAAQNISDPLRIIGRLGSQPALNAWKTSQAVMGVARAFNVENFRKAQAVFDKAGIKGVFDEGMGYFTTQEGMALEGELLQQDVMATRRVSDARPTTVVEARLKAGSKNYSQRIEAFVARRKVDVARPFGLDTGEAALTRARGLMAEKAMKMGLSPDDARRLVDDLDADGLSMIDAAYYGHKVKSFNAAKRAAKEANASGHAAAQTVPGAADNVVDRTTLIGSRELTAGRAATLRATLEGNLTTAEKAAAGREAIQNYDHLGINFTAVGPTDEEIVTGLKGWLDAFDDDLVKELSPEQMAALPDELRAVIDPNDGYIYGLRPEGEAEWRIKTDPNDPSRVVYTKPWIDTVGDVAQPWNTRFNQNGTKVETMLNALERVMGQMGHQITTERIFGEARRSFIEKSIGGYAPGQTTALTYQQADSLWSATIDMAKTLKTSPRGMDMDEFAEVIKKVPGVAAAGITPRDLMGIALHSFEGRLSTVGVTQKISGTAKRVGFEVTGMNGMGRIAERMYPMVRFSMNPFFQIQEWIEPWVFSAARGKKARLSGGWVDPVTGVKVEATEVMRIQQQLIDRYAASNPYAQFDQMERSLVFLYGGKAAKSAARKTDVSKLESGREMLAKAMTPGDRKRVAQSEMFRHFLGPTLRDQLNSVNPRAWLELEMEYGTKDLGTIAVRYLTEKDVWAAVDPRAANVLTEAVKARQIGAQSVVRLDDLVEHGFKTTRPALTLAVKDGTMTLDNFRAKMRDFGAHDEYTAKAWRMLQFEAKEGGLDNWWAEAAKAPGVTEINVQMARSLVQRMAEVAGVSELEFISRTMSGSFVNILSDDLIRATSGDYAGWESLFQQAKFAKNNWFSTDASGAIVHETLTPAEAEARFLTLAKEPPSRLPAHMHGAYDDMQRVEFGAGGRAIHIPGGQAALDDLEKPWTVWEAHLIRNQLVDPNELLDPKMKHALYYKMWKAHQIDMADPAGTFRVYNNMVMAMLSAGLNLTRNELISTRFRINSMEELAELADETGRLRESIEATLPAGQKARANDLGLAYSTRRDVAHYIPLDKVDDYATDAYLPATQTKIADRARNARGYLGLTKAERDRHAEIMRDAARRGAVSSAEQRADDAVTKAKEALDAAVDDDARAAAQANLDEATAARAAIDPEEELRLAEERDQNFIDDMNEEEIAKLDKRAEKASGRISEWAIDQVTDLLVDADDDLIAVRQLPVEYITQKTLDKIIATEADRTRFLSAAQVEAAARKAGTYDPAAREVLRELVPGAQAIDNALIWKPWNVEGAGRMYGQAPDGQIVGHGDKELFAYIKNDDVAWRGFSTNAGMGNALMMAEDMAKNPQHYVRRRGQAPAIIQSVPVEHAPRNLLDQMPTGKPGEVAYIDNATAQDMIATYSGPDGRPVGYVRIRKARPADAKLGDGWWRDLSPGKAESIHVFVDPAARRQGIATKMYDWLEKEGWDLSVSGTEVTPEGRAFATARAEQTLEPLDEFAERVSHRTRGLSLKTGYFGVDLGDPINFERGVMDTHMIGDLTEWMYYDVTNKGTTPEWSEFLASLSPAKRTQIKAWIERKFTRVDEEIDGVKTGKKVEVPHPEGAPRGAGVYDWSEATGVPFNFKASGREKELLDAAVRDGDTRTVASFVRTKIGKIKAEFERERLQRLYRTDEELAELYGRDVKVLGGDYKVYEDIMARRKAELAIDDPTLNSHGHGGFQWKLWDDRRKVYDPEATAFRDTHDLPREAAIRHLASSDDVHYASGFMDKGGLRSVADAGYRYLDPTTTVMAQEAPEGALRGATMFKDPFERVIALTEHANASTLVHELTHALLEPMLDPSGRQIVFDDLNRAITRANDQTTVKLIYAKEQVNRLTQVVIDTQNALLDAKRIAKEARTDATSKTSAAQAAERDLAATELALAQKSGALEQVIKHAEARRQAINARTLPPSRRTALLQTVENDLQRAKASVDTLTAKRDAIRDTVEPLWDEANTAQTVAKSADDDAGIISTTLTQNKAEGRAAKAEYDTLATTMPRATKSAWDREVSEHFADEFNKWLATGKAPSVEMRDVFAYFRRVLTKLKDWVTQENITVSPEMDALFTKMLTPDPVTAEAFTNPVAFNATQEAMHAAARHAVVDAEDAAFTNVQFRRGRSWMERSINHPYMGVYPFSYMWGKVMPEMVRALALNPFGIPIPGMVEGATPGLGFLNAQRVWSAVEMQKDTDPEFRKFMNDPKNDKFFRGLSMLSPATPWDMPANYPLYARRLSEWGLEQQDRREQGRQEKGFDAPKVAGEVASYAFGPASSLDWLSDIAKWGDAPIIGQGTGEGGTGALRAKTLVLQGGGQAPKTLEQSLKEASGTLQSSLGQ